MDASPSPGSHAPKKALRAKGEPSVELREILLIIPFTLLLGFHVSVVAMLVRRWTFIPYLLTMIVLYLLLLMPLWLMGSQPLFWPKLVVSILVLASLVIMISAAGRKEIIEGSNFEASAPAHIVLMLAYANIAAIDMAMKAAANG